MKKLNKQNGITLIALIITIIVMLILVAVTISMAINGGLFEKAGKATKDTKDAMNEEQALANGQIIIDGKTYASIDEYFNGTSVAMFDTGTNVITKIHTLAKDGEISAGVNLSINEIKEYEGTPDLTKMTEANIVSWSDGYKAFEQEPDKYKNIVPEGYELCPIYMWFEENEGTEKRNFFGKLGTVAIGNNYDVKTGTIYWWSESKNVYMNPDSSNMFSYLPYLTNISGLQKLKTTYVTNMNSIFKGSTQNLQNVNALKDWDTTNVENMECLLYSWNENDRRLDINGLKNWNTSNVKNMSSMFVGTGIEDSEVLKNWNTSKVTNMSYMFGDGDVGGSLKNLDGISNWNVSNVTNMQGMFYYCQVENLDAISNWDVSNVTNMQNMFWSSHVENLNTISNWNVNNVDSMDSMFYNCQNLTDASEINDWNIKSDCNFTKMFFNCSTHPNFTKVTGTWDENGTFLPN